MSETNSKKPKQPRIVPSPVGQLTILSRKVAKGLEDGGTAAGIRFATSEEIFAKIGELTGAESDYQEILASKSMNLIPALKAADATGRKFIMDAKHVLSLPLGSKWNQGWAEVAFLNDNLQCPSTVVERLATIEGIAKYFAKYPAYENAPQKITAEQATNVATALSGAHDALDRYDADRKELRKARDKAQTALRKAINGVIAEARRRLPIDSPVWDTFGVTAPKARAPRPRKEKVAKAAKAARPTSAAATTDRSAENAETKVELPA